MERARPTVGGHDDGAGTLKNIDSNANSAAANCPIEAPEIYVVNKAQLDQRAMEGLSNLEPAKPTIKTTPLEAPAPVVKPIEPSKDHIANSRSTVLNHLKGWREAWINMKPDAYFSFYSQKYTSRDSWKSARRARLMSAQKISLDLSDIRFTMQDDKHATTTFQQDYRSTSYQDSLEKTLFWEEINGKWLIVNEMVSGPKAKQW